MSLTDKEILEFKDALTSCARPLIYFDGDTDGLSSFLQMYKLQGDARGVVISGRPQLSADYLRKIDELAPDAIFILDLAQVTQEFIDGTKLPVYWLDHHDPNHGLKLPKHVHYFNPRLHDDSDGRPTSYWAYRICQGDLWLAMVGIVGDYFFECADEFKKEHPDLLPPETKNQGEALFNTELGKLIKILNFNLKGAVSSALTSVKILTRIQSPDEILHQTTSKGRFIYKKYERVQQSYERHFKAVKDSVKEEDDVILYIYHDEQYSLSGDLANEVKFTYPNQIVIIGRQHDGKYIMSFRSENRVIVDALQKSLEGTGGYGGGHPKACGGVVPEDQFEGFIKRFKELVKQ